MENKMFCYQCEQTAGGKVCVNFDPDRFVEYIHKGNKFKEEIMESAGEIFNFPDEAKYMAPDNKEDMLKDSKNIGIMFINDDLDMDIRSLRKLLIYGMKGIGVYAHHSHVFGEYNDYLYNFFYKGLTATIDDTLTVDDLFKLNMECGKTNY